MREAGAGRGMRQKRQDEQTEGEKKADSNYRQVDLMSLLSNSMAS